MGDLFKDAGVCVNVHLSNKMDDEKLKFWINIVRQKSCFDQFDRRREKVFFFSSDNPMIFRFLIFFEFSSFLFCVTDFHSLSCTHASHKDLYRVLHGTRFEGFHPRTFTLFDLCDWTINPRCRYEKGNRERILKRDWLLVCELSHTRGRWRE